jgi:hypothetical protein
MVNPVPFKPTKGSASEERLKRYLWDRVESIKRGLDRLHGLDGIVKWRKAYEAVPAQPTRDFPWSNASNLVVPIIAIHSDTLLARAMAAVFKTRPLWVTKSLGDFAKTAPEGLRDGVEEFLQWAALEPDELNLYQEYEGWFGEAIRLGTSVMKTPWVHEMLHAPAGDGWQEKVLYDGPRPRKLKFENFKCPVNVGTIAEMDFKYDLIQLSKSQLEQRAYQGIYDPVAVKHVLGLPDRQSNVGQVQSQKEQDAKVRTVPGYGFAEWDICECHFTYHVDEGHFAKVIVWYHQQSEEILRSFYHYYPDEIYIATRLFFRDDMFHGRGFAEMLLPFQEEISEIHNQRRDNMTIANMKMWAVDPNSPLHKGFKTYPSAMVPAKQLQGQREIEPLEMGTPVQGEIESERLSLELAERLSGVSPPMQGYGAGTNTKRGVYTAMGTLSLLQEGNTRTDLNISDIRFSHTRLGRLLCLEYGAFGVGEERLQKFGELAPKIEYALQAISDGRMALPIYSATASVNREVEKQSDLMLQGVMDRYRQGVMTLMGQIPQMPPNIQPHAIQELEAAWTLMQMTLRHFGYDEVERLAPKPPTQQMQQQQMQQQAQAAAQAQQRQMAGPPGQGQQQMGSPVGSPGGQPQLPQVMPMGTTELSGGPPIGGGRTQ